MNVIALIFILIITQDYAIAISTIIVAPQILYVLDGQQGTLRCQNRSLDEEIYYSSIKNAVWYRHFENESNKTVNSTGTVLTRGYALYFKSPLQEDEGYYFCCNQDGLCSTTMTAVILSKPPNITAINKLHTAEVGRDAVLECIIFSLGKPLASLSWTKSGVRFDESKVTRNNSVFTITLKNVTMDDAGYYTCSAVSGNIYRNDHIRLNVIATPIETLSKAISVDAGKNLVSITKTFTPITATPTSATNNIVSGENHASEVSVSGMAICIILMSFIL